MKRLAILCLLPTLGCAQDMAARGADVFAKSCATGYCHGSKGGSGSTAPRLAARDFSEDYIAQTIRRGIPGTAMPAFGDVLPRAEVIAVIAYVDSLNGITPRNPAPQADTEKKLPPEAVRGRELFFDALRGFGRCSTCHQVDGFGVPAAAPIAQIPADAATLRQLPTPRVQTAIAAGESFPALVVSQGKNQVKLYDLTSPPPVLRSLSPASVTLTQGSQWRHSSALSSYSDAELESILAFVRAASAP
jgi:mono/diheme cytochrome c family protein